MSIFLSHFVLLKAGYLGRLSLLDSLASGELYIAIAVLFRRLDLVLHETLRARDVDIVRDCFIGEVAPDTQGIRVKFPAMAKDTGT